MFIATLFNLLLNETNCYLISIDATLVKDPGEGGGGSPILSSNKREALIVMVFFLVIVNC